VSDLRSSFDPKFRDTLRNWIDVRGQILVLIQYPRAAGLKDFILVDDFSSLETLLDSLRPQTRIVAFNQPQLPLRGLVDAVFIARATQEIEDGEEYLALLIETPKYGLSSYSAGETHEELRLSLAEWVGYRVAVGQYPPWTEDTSEVISAFVPDEDGRIQRGVY